jgi:hypothetical protein
LIGVHNSDHNCGRNLAVRQQVFEGPGGEYEAIGVLAVTKINGNCLPA